MRHSIVKLFASLLVGLTMVALVFIATGVEAQSPGIDINGLYWGDGDYMEYNFLSESEPGGRGFLYGNRVAPGLIYALVRVSYVANDNCFEPFQSNSYCDSVGWNPLHDFGALEGSDHLSIFLECGGDRWEWSQDLIYDADPGAGFDWRSDSDGPDGVAVTSSTGATIPPSGIVLTSHSSLEYNLENSSWILITQTNASPNPNDWMSLDLSPLGTISTTDPITDVNAITGVHEDYPFYRSTGAAATDLYEWEISYEMVLDDSHCPAGPTFLGADSAHNSPAKDDVEDIEIPTAIRLTSVAISSGSLDEAPHLLIVVALLALTSLMTLLLIRMRSSKDSQRI